MRWRALLIVLIVLMLGGCGRDPQKTLEQVDQSLTAWSSTLQLAGDDRRALPPLYIRQLAKAAEKQLDEQQEQLSRTPPDNPTRRDLEARLKEVRAQKQAFKDAAVGGGGA